MAGPRWPLRVVNVLPICALLGGVAAAEAPLRALAEGRRMLLGTCVGRALIIDDEQQYRDTLAREFNIVVPENSMKFRSLCPRTRGDYAFEEADALVEFAEAHRMKVRGHALVWHQSLPRWFSEREWSREEAMSILRDHVHRVVGRYKGRLLAWDVVNEAITDKPVPGLRDTPWLNAIGPDYLEIGFQWAHEADPECLLFYNDYGIGHGGRKLNRVIELVEGMRERGIPIHGVGFQMHLSERQSYDPDDLRASIRRVEALGLQVHITEMDVRIKQPATAEQLDHQADIYRDAMAVALAEPACTAFLTWGFTDRHSWIPGHSKGKDGSALVLDEQYRPKPAYHALQEAMSSGTPQPGP